MADHPLGGFLAATQFLTRVPVRLRRAPDLAAAVVWFPVIGALVGALAGGIVALLGRGTTPAVGAAVGVLVAVLVTGAFHEDGLADLADAVAGGTTPERRLEILKDPRHGTYGVAALCGSIVLRVVIVGSLPASVALAGLISAHALGRGAAVVPMAVVPLARPDGLGAGYAAAVGRSRAIGAAAVATAIGAVATGWWVGPLVAAAAAAAVVVVLIARRTLGGITGDVLGAIEQVAECAVLLVASILAADYALWWR